MRDHTHKQQVDEETFEKICDALTLYKEHVDDDFDSMPVSYTVPSTDPWPERLWSLKLGVQLKTIRDNEKFVRDESKAKRLQEIGLDFKSKDKPSYTQKRFDLVVKALDTFKALYGDLLVPQNFVVPTEEPWPEETWNMKLYVCFFFIETYALILLMKKVVDSFVKSDSICRGVRVSAIRCQGVLVDKYPDRRCVWLICALYAHRSSSAAVYFTYNDTLTIPYSSNHNMLYIRVVTFSCVEIC